MLFTNSDHRKQNLMEEIEYLKKERISLIKERDIIFDQIRDQREGKLIIEHEKTKIEEKIDFDLSLSDSVKKALRKHHNDYLNIVEKQKNIVLELNEKIKIKEKELEEYEKKELIDIDGLNLKYKKEIDNKIIEIGELNGQIDHMKKSMVEFEKYRIEESQKLDKIRVYQEKVKSSLNVREQKLRLKEKRLNKLHLELKSKTNGKNMIGSSV